MSSDATHVMRLVRRIRKNSDRMQQAEEAKHPKRIYEALANSSPVGFFEDLREAVKACERHVPGRQVKWVSHPDHSEEDSLYGYLDGAGPESEESITDHDPFEILAASCYATVEQWEEEWDGTPWRD